MTDFAFSTRPDDATLKAWYRGLEPAARKCLQEYPLQIPFWYYGYPGQFAAACLANEEVQRNCQAWPDCHKLEDYARRPVFRMEFAMGVAIGCLEVLDWAKKKTWGPLDWVAPILSDDPVHPMFLEFCHNPATSIWHQRLMQKQWLKRKLGRGGAGLVHRARKESMTNFVGVLTTGESAGLVSESAPMADLQLAHAYEKRVARVRSDGVKLWKCRWRGEPETETAKWIRRTLHLTAEEFWRAARCKIMLTPEQKRGPQRTLF
jgi:hypothetical protein